MQAIVQNFGEKCRTSTRARGSVMSRFSNDNTTRVVRSLTVQGVAIGLYDLVGTRTPVAATRIEGPRDQIEQQWDAVPPPVSYAEHLEVAFGRLHIRESIEETAHLLGRAPFVTVTNSSASFGRKRNLHWGIWIYAVKTACVRTLGYEKKNISLISI